MAISDQEFQNHVFNNKNEFANRQVLFKGDGEPNLSTDPAVNNALTGTFYYDTLNNLRYQKEGFTSTDWIEVGTGGTTDEPWITIDQNTNATAEARYLADTTGGSFTVYLPTPANINDTVTIVPLYPTYDTQPLTVSSVNSNIMGSATDLIVDQLGASIVLEYVGTVSGDDVGWAVIRQGDISLINNIDNSGVGLYVELTEGSDPYPAHTHAAVLTDANVQDLIGGVVSSIVITSSIAEGHSHDITCEYTQGAIIITNIASNHVFAHSATIINSNKILSPWEVVTTADAVGDYQLQDADRKLADSTNGSFNFLLPLSPDVGQIISIAPLQPTYASNPVTVLRNGELVNSQAEDILLDQIGLAIELIYVGGSVGWAVIERGDTAIINNILVDNGTIVATQPGNNTFSGLNDFTGATEISVPTPINNQSATNKLYVDELVNNTTPTDVAFINTSNTFVGTGAINNFLATEVLVSEPLSDSNPTTKRYVDDEISASTPTGVAFLGSPNNFTVGGNIFTPDFTIGYSGTPSAYFNVGNDNVFLSPSQNGNVTLGRGAGAISFDGVGSNLNIGSFFSNINIGSTSTNNIDLRSTFDITLESNTDVNIGTSVNTDNVIIRAEEILLDANSSIEVNCPFNVDVAQGGEFNIVDVPGSTLVLQSGGDFEVTAGDGGSLWLQGLRMPNSDGLNGQVLTTNGFGSLQFTSIPVFDIEEDYTIYGDWLVEGEWLYNGNIRSVGKVDVITPLDSLTSSVTTLEIDKKYTIEVNSPSSTSNYTLPSDTPNSMTIPNKLPQLEVIIVGVKETTFTTHDGSNFWVNGLDSGSDVYEVGVGEEVRFVRATVNGTPQGNWWVLSAGSSTDDEVKLVSTDTYLVADSDNGKTLDFTSNNTITMTINSGLGDNFSFTVLQSGDGKIQWAGTAAVNNVDTHVRTRGKYAMATFVSRLDGVFTVGGATEA